MTIYCGVDFHARQHTIYFCDTADGEVCLKELCHDCDALGGFYAQFTGDVIVGLEASGYSTWFVELLEGLGHQVFIGDAAEVRRRARRRQKNDRRDAELIDLLARVSSRGFITPRSRVERCYDCCATATAWCRCERESRTASKHWLTVQARLVEHNC